MWVIWEKTEDVPCFKLVLNSLRFIAKAVKVKFAADIKTVLRNIVFWTT